MIRLHHAALSPFGRWARTVLAEKGIEAALIEAPLDPEQAAVAAAEAGFGVELGTTAPRARPFGAPLAPALIDGRAAICGARPIVEYLEEIGGARPLAPEDPAARAEMRRLCDWAEAALWREAVEPVLRERFLKKLFNAGAPDVGALRAASSAGRSLLRSLGVLLERRDWVSGERLGLADFAVAAQLSVLDYFGDRPWIGGDKTVGAASDWYALMKSRPAFRGVLADRVLGSPPAEGYLELDF